MKELFAQFDNNALTRMQAIFASIFILQNRLQTVYEKNQGDLTMKQWLLIAITEICPKPHTLTNISKYMGCSRQNVKQLATALAKKGYARLLLGAQNSVHIELTEKVATYEKKMGSKSENILRMLFSEFNEEEISLFYQFYAKLYMGVERIENDQNENENEGEYAC
jgi:DNA-binding MarR family transcriptional regulator